MADISGSKANSGKARRRRFICRPSAVSKQPQNGNALRRAKTSDAPKRCSDTRNIVELIGAPGELGGKSNASGRDIHADISGAVPTRRRSRNSLRAPLG